jgi:hypothetical protein
MQTTQRYPPDSTGRGDDPRIQRRAAKSPQVSFGHRRGLRPGAKLLVMIQGMFESGDSLRNAIHDYKLPLFAIIGYRSYLSQKNIPGDSARIFTEPILNAWNLEYRLIDAPEKKPLIRELRLAANNRPAVLPKEWHDGNEHSDALPDCLAALKQVRRATRLSSPRWGGREWQNRSTRQISYRPVEHGTGFITRVTVAQPSARSLFQRRRLDADEPWVARHHHGRGRDEPRADCSR